ncbi:MAG: hypothetical protein WKG06_06360 [Segetibacter sp.]
MSKGLLVVKSIDSPAIGTTDCSSYLFTGYRTTGIKAAGALHRLLYGT